MSEVLKKPKAELHMHLEGSLEPEMLFKLAKRNNISLKHNSVAELKQAYKFNNLQEFLDIYYQGMSVLQTEQDFFDLTYAYLEKSHQDNVVFSEMFFDPQAHLERGIKLATVFNGITQAITQAKTTLNITASLIPCFLRHLSEDNALHTFDLLMDHRDKFIGIGLDSSELGNPPSKFKRLFDKARNEKLRLVAHAGEEGPASYVWEAIDILGIERIDHGNSILTDETLIKRIAKDKIGLTMCPLSNQCLQVVSDLQNHQALTLLNQGVKVTLNSDDPAYFGGYVNANYQALIDELKLTDQEVSHLIQNSLDVKFV
ncbi:MAG: adenosine deaminase [Neisseriaceae bacterium]|nr:MAG: adenosine deaminase [Neisseriaceae bacterium]